MFFVDRISRPMLMGSAMVGCVCILITECVLVARNPPGPGENKAALKAAVAMIFRKLTTPLFLSTNLTPSPLSSMADELHLRE